MYFFPHVLLEHKFLPSPKYIYPACTCHLCTTHTVLISQSNESMVGSVTNTCFVEHKIFYPPPKYIYPACTFICAQHHGSVTNSNNTTNQQRNHYKYPTHLPPWFDKSLENPQTKQKCIFFPHILLEHKIFYPPPKYIYPACTCHLCTTTWFTCHWKIPLKQKCTHFVRT